MTNLFDIANRLEEEVGGPIHPSGFDGLNFIGLNYLDHTAIEAMKILLKTDPVGVDGNDELAGTDAEGIAKRSYLMAKAMLEERKKHFT